MIQHVESNVAIINYGDWDRDTSKTTQEVIHENVTIAAFTQKAPAAISF
jgi:hypothetical protein